MATKVAVIGAGSWGTAVAAIACRNASTVLWARRPEVAEQITVEHVNNYLPDLALPDDLTATADLDEALSGADVVVMAVPSHGFREVLEQGTPAIADGVPLVSLTKGVEQETLPGRKLAFLSGPSFAKEVGIGLPTAVVMASRDRDAATQAAKLFHSERFRVYTSDDVTGVELGGALKNVMAIAAGIADGLGLGHNTRAALITRGLAEISRLAVRKGANPLTLAGLAGMGDLVLTCTGDLSRNRTVGMGLGQGKKLSDVLAGMSQVAEGVKTTRSAHDLAERLGVEMPITQSMYHVLYEDLPAKEALSELLGRQPKHELA